MTSKVRTVRGRTSLQEVTDLLTEYHLSALPVVDEDERLVGVISMTDLIRLGKLHAGDMPGQRVLEVPQEPVALAMNADPLTVPASMSIARVARTLIRRRVHRVYVTEDECLRGVFAMRDVIRIVAEGSDATPIVEYMNELAQTMPHTASLPDAVGRLDASQVHAMIVTREGAAVGVFSQDEALTARHIHEHGQVEEVMNRAILTLPHDTPIHRAAQQAILAKPSVIVVTHNNQICGALSPTDFAFAIM